MFGGLGFQVVGCRGSIGEVIGNGCEFISSIASQKSIGYNFLTYIRKYLPISPASIQIHFSLPPSGGRSYS